MSFAVVNDLFRASRSGDSVSVERILSSGIDANACAVLEGGVRQPCFFAAALNGHEQTLEIFWKHGANFRTERDSDQQTVLDLLGRLGKEDMAAVVFKISARPESERGPQKDWGALLKQAMDGTSESQIAQVQQVQMPFQQQQQHQQRSPHVLGVVGELSGLLASLQAERTALAEEMRTLASRDARLAAEMQAVIAQLQLLPRVAN